MPPTQKVHPWNEGFQVRLAALGEKKPERKAAQIRALWPDIKVARERGHSLKTICDCLEADGIRISVTTLGSYITRMQRKDSQAMANLIAAGGSVPQTLRSPVPAREKAISLKPEEPRDPLLNLRKQKPVFDYRPELADPKKLI